MTAIITKFHPSTKKKPDRISATTGNGHRIIMSVEAVNEAYQDRKHRFVAEALCSKLGWTGRLIQGSFKGCEVFVFADRP